MRRSRRRPACASRSARAAERDVHGRDPAEDGALLAPWSQAEGPFEPNDETDALQLGRVNLDEATGPPHWDDRDRDVLAAAIYGPHRRHRTPR